MDVIIKMTCPTGSGRLCGRAKPGLQRELLRVQALTKDKENQSHLTKLLNIFEIINSNVLISIVFTKKVKSALSYSFDSGSARLKDLILNSIIRNIKLFI